MPCHTPFWHVSVAGSGKQLIALEVIENVCKQKKIWIATLSAGEQGLEPASAVPKFMLAWICLAEVCIHIICPRVPYRGLYPGAGPIKCERSLIKILSSPTALLGTEVAWPWTVFNHIIKFLKTLFLWQSFAVSFWIILAFFQVIHWKN